MLRVFPAFFLLVAALVCLTTMTRMVEEQRIQIGTLKALGYRSGAIASKFLIYALVATIAGSLCGISGRHYLFPTIIYNAYGILYTMIPAHSVSDWDCRRFHTGRRRDSIDHCSVFLLAGNGRTACIADAPKSPKGWKAGAAGANRVFMEPDFLQL